MKQSQGVKLLDKIVAQFKRLSFSMKETPKTEVDDFELEHFLLYHGLIGSSPANQREFRDVRADIMEAVKTGSSAQLAIALKLPPLWWGEKLEAIVLEMGASQDSNLGTTRLIELLMPPEGGDFDPDSFSLTHQDWRVKSNAAGILANLDRKQASCTIATFLDDTTSAGKIAFCHISNALGKLGTQEGKRALLPYLYNQEPWLRVDAARALSLWPFATISSELSEALLSHHALSDYMSIAVARNHKPMQFLTSGNHNQVVYQGGLEMIIQIVEATSQTFPQELGHELGLDDCWDILNKDLQSHVTPRQIRATLSLANWLRKDPDHLTSEELNKQIAQILDCLASTQTTQVLTECLSSQATTVDAVGQKRHAAYLVGKLGIAEAGEILKSQIAPDSPIINEVIDSLAMLNCKSASHALISLVDQLVNLDERTKRAQSTQPVLEESPKPVVTYWTILRALAHMPAPETVELLIKASGDFAPDKRQQALDSLLSVIEKDPSCYQAVVVEQLIGKAIEDPAPAVKVVALKGVGQLALVDFASEVVNACLAKENSIKRQAQASIQQLILKGHRQAIVKAAQHKLKMEFDPYRRRDLERLIS